jgi:uncharacterized protein (TIGR03067 family)
MRIWCNQYNVPFVIADGKITWKRLPFVNPDKGEGTFTVDTTKTPPTIDLKAGGKLYQGIYRLRVNKESTNEYLDMLFAKPGEKRPTAFADAVLQVPKGFPGFLLTAVRPLPEERDPNKQELAALQGTWQCRAGESNGKDDGREAPKLWVIVIDKDTFLYKENGKLVAVEKLKIDVSQSPKQMTVNFTYLKQTDVMIFLRVGDVLLLCGNRDGKTRPTKFESGTKAGGAFLTAWERVK